MSIIIDADYLRGARMCCMLGRRQCLGSCGGVWDTDILLMIPDLAKI